MKPSSLKPGQRVIVNSGLGAPREMTFLRRLRPGFEIQLGQGAECLFQCEAFRGMNGPDDPGVCTMTDARAARAVRVAGGPPGGLVIQQIATAGPSQEATK